MSSQIVKSMAGNSGLIFSQNLKLTRLSKSGRIEEAITIFNSMAIRNIFTYNSMISGLAKNGRIHEARHLFDTMPSKNLVSWNTMIAGYSHNDCVRDAHRLFEEMPERDAYSWTLLITCYTRNGELDKAQYLLDKMPDKKGTVVCYNAMIAGYAKNGRFGDARRLLSEMSFRDLVTWNSLLAGYTQNEEMELALKFFNQEMPERDVVSWNLMVEGFVRIGDLDSAWALFERISHPNVVSWVTMLNGFGRSGRIVEARKLFDQMPERNVVSWNAMMSGYVQSMQIEEAHKIFVEMPEKNSVSWTTMINGYVRAGKLKQAREFLDKMPYKNVAAQTAMIAGYVQSMRMEEAREIFEDVRVRDCVCWNTMISGYAQCGRMDEALGMFRRMPKKDIVSWNTMIAGYAQNGKMDKAIEIFNQTRERNTVTWNSIISGFAQNGYYLEALEHFLLMKKEGRKPDWSSYACVLSACAHLAALHVGEQLHLLLLRSGYVAAGVFACNALITMYSRCGRISRARQVFNEIDNLDLISWNSLIAGYALNGYGKEALVLFREMEMNGISPDEITFVGVLSACSHAGMIDDGLTLFNSLSTDYNVSPVAEHYACMVDLLGRAGRLEQAYELVKRMSIKPNAGIWGALLGACRIRGEPDLANFAAEKLFEFEPHKTSNYVQLSNIHAEAGRWSEVKRVRSLMKETGAQKQPGCSWIEIRNTVCAFFSDDPMQSRTAEVCSVLKTLSAQMRSLGLHSCSILVFEG